MATLRLTDVSKTYPNGVEAVSNVSVDVKSGAFVVIVGPSGCGKSTLLRMVAGLERVTAGGVEIDGKRVESLEPRERDIAMVFQNYALYPHMSVFDNMAYGLKNRGESREEIRRKVGEAAEMLGLSGLLKRKPRELSGGQRQRVAMGRAIVRQPKVFLFDEPLSNLDAKLRASMRVEIKRLQRELGVTALFVTHDQTEAMTMADQLIAMNAGRVEQVGAPLELYRRPESLFVAGFIGAPAMNILGAETEPGARLAAMAAAEGAAQVGVRPEALRVGPVGGAPIAGRIELVEALGAEALVHVRAPGHDGHLVARLPAAQTPAEGAEVGLSADPAEIAAFGPDGRRLEPSRVVAATA